MDTSVPPPPPPPSDKNESSISSSIPPPPPQNKASAPKRKKPKHWVVEEEDNEKWKFDPLVAKRINLSKVIWKEALGFTHSESGSEGVLFFGWEGDRVAVVKGSSTVMADQFTQELGEIVDMPFPKSRIVRFIFDHELHEIEDAVVTLEHNKKESERGRHQKLLSLPVLMIIEFVGGKDMYEADFKDDFSDPIKKHAILKNLGRIVSFDVLVNNWDRFPLIWEHEGNLGNIFFTGDESRPVVGIDQTTSCIDPAVNPQGVEEYLQKVRDLLQSLLQFKEHPANPYIMKVADCFTRESGITLEAENMYCFWEGMLIGIRDICHKIKREDMEKIYGRMDAQMTELINAMTWGADTTSRYGLSKINLEFLDLVIAEFKKVLPEVERLQKGVHKE
eukprot:TRINITY_DN4491_c0_g2_i2.p1 TRINITY_DN4491_c0_g2~~TRINITY_DN4491_c0_g2_i2.p1  ORF type:complete len:391 (-),score=72.80 TRINITY_DN4491_c0_g2_i2:21-1193(-)